MRGYLFCHPGEAVTISPLRPAGGTMSTPQRRQLIGRKPPLQIVLIAVVALAALASAISSRFSHGPAMDSADAINAVSRMPPSSTPPVENTPTPSQPIENAIEAARRGDLDA